MKKLLSCLLILGVFMISFSAQAQDDGGKTYTLDALEAKKLKENADKSVPVVTDEELKERLDKLSHQIPMRFNKLVKSHIVAYTQRRRSSTETIISRSTIYFPIFENALVRHNIPSDLKYLAIIESALSPKALSPAGAGGLWQFMPGTGKMYDLRINKYVDERSDPYMASDAAARFLKDLYKRYDDWLLVIAAYNCGPGRVNKAIKKAGSSDYWTIIRYLPKETRNYVPAFIAAAYTMNYYHLHNIYPTFPEYDLQVTEKVKLYKNMTLKEIADKSGTSLETVQFLNPSYKKGFVPKSSEGYLVILPMSNMMAFKETTPEAKPYYFESPSYTLEPKAKLASYGEAKGETVMAAPAPSEPTVKRRVEYKKEKQIYRVKRGDNLGKIAKKHRVSVKNLRKWNKLKSSMIHVNQKLVIYKTKKIVIEEPVDEVVFLEDEAKDAQPQADMEAPVAPAELQKEEVPTDRVAIQYDVRKGDTLWKIASRYEGVTVKQLMSWNGITHHSQLRAGMQLSIFTK